MKQLQISITFSIVSMSAWATPSSSSSSSIPATPISLSDVMSEELVKHLTEEEKGKEKEKDLAINAAIANQELDVDLHAFLDLGDDQCYSDETLAKCLQHEFDKEYDAQLKKEERFRNGDSKVSISWERYRRVQDSEEEDSDVEYDPEYGPECRYWDEIEEAQRQQVQVGSRGFVTKDGVVTTKHDAQQNQLKNAVKAMDLNCEVGDGTQLKLNNKVFNALKKHSIHEGKRHARLHEKKEKSTADLAIDENTKLIVFKFINKGILDEANGIVATGKESVILHARGQDAKEGITSQEMAIKVYRTTLNKFKSRDAYVVGDPRFSTVKKLGKQNPRIFIPIWAEKERDNLRRLRHHNIPCPQPVALKKHVLVMTFIGKDARPAPTLKDANLNESDLTNAWQQVQLIMKTMYRDCDLIHGDLSEYNLLWHERKVYVIDVSQSVVNLHPNSLMFLWRDCCNICRFFKSRLPSCASVSPQDLFQFVSGKQFDQDSDQNTVELLSKIANFKNFDPFEEVDPFEEMLEKSKKEREKELENAAHNNAHKGSPNT